MRNPGQKTATPTSRKMVTVSSGETLAISQGVGRELSVKMTQWRGRNKPCFVQHIN